MSEHVCGSTATSTGDPCQTPVSEPGETCWRETHIAGSLDHLTPKQRRFVEEYTGHHLGNATQAAIAAGYSEKAAAEIGYENLRKPHIAEAVEQRLDRKAMPADEALAHIAEIARGDIGALIEVQPDGTWRLDLEKAEEAGNLSLVRELSYDKRGNPKLKTYSRMDALKALAKVHGLFVDKMELSGKVDTGGVLVVPVTPDEDAWTQLARREQVTGSRENGAGGS